MKSKKGFTLVELLAVIAILAILVLIALPNILNLYRNARENVFVNEVQNIIRSAQQAYVTNSLTDKSKTCFDSISNPLDIESRSNLKYKVELSQNGKIISIQVMDNNYQLIKTNGTNIKRDDIGNSKSNKTIKSETRQEGVGLTACDGSTIEEGEEVKETKKLIIKKDNEEYKNIDLEENITTTIEKEEDYNIITCNNGIEVSEENDQINLDNILVNNSICNFSNDLSDIIDNLDDTENNILLLNDISLEKQVTINKPITIDMNGKSITSSFEGHAIVNSSNLTIKNNSDSESLITTSNVVIINNENSTSNLEKIKLICTETTLSRSTIYNNGKLIIKDSYIEGPFGIGGNDAETATFDIYNSKIKGTLFSGVGLNESVGSSGNIYNSTITGKNNAIASYSTGTINIYSGTFIGETGKGISNNGAGTINICSGEINGATSDLNNSSTGTINYTSKVTLKNSTKNGTNINLTEDITCN